MENLKVIEHIYYGLENLSDMWVDSPEMKEKEIRICRALNEKFGGSIPDIGDKKMYDDAEVYEKRGFIHGFQSAISLLVGVGKVVS